MSEDRPTREELQEENRRLRAALAEKRRQGSAGASEQEGEELFQRIFRLNPVGLTLSRVSDGGIIDVNPEFCRLAGYERAELVDRTPAQVGLWDEEERRAELCNQLQSRGVVHDFELTLRTADDWPLRLAGSFQLLTLGGEKAVLSVLSDIGARKRAEQSLRLAKQQAERAREEAQDLAQFRSSVVTNITHEVRTPLTVILGFTSILREGVDGSHRRFVDLIERSGRRLLLTLDSVLDLAQLESGTLDIDVRPHNILDAIDSVASTTRPFAEEKNLTFEVDLPDQALYAKIDSELFSRALIHLVDNAIKFTDEGRVVLRAGEEEGRVLVQVEDTGVGIGEDFLPELFDTFSQESSGMERDYQGSGMGLTVAAQLVDRFDGELQVESEKGRGSTFTIALPKVERAAGSTALRVKVA